MRIQYKPLVRYIWLGALVMGWAVPLRAPTALSLESAGPVRENVAAAPEPKLGVVM